MNASSKISNPVQKICDKITLAEQRFHRNPGSVSWVAVSKGQPFSAIEAIYQQGQIAFAENYVQEALSKIQQAESKDLRLHWHYIGRIQSNKLTTLACHFDWVQTLESFTQASRLNTLRPLALPPLNCCIQITLKDSNPLTTTELKNKLELALAITKLERLSLRGVMCMIPQQKTFDQQRKYFAVCREVYEQLQQTLPFLDTLSMGMSGDFEAAIAEGATLLRLGTVLFGPRLNGKGIMP